MQARTLSVLPRLRPNRIPWNSRYISLWLPPVFGVETVGEFGCDCCKAFVVYAYIVANIVAIYLAVIIKNFQLFLCKLDKYMSVIVLYNKSINYSRNRQNVSGELLLTDIRLSAILFAR